MTTTPDETTLHDLVFAVVDRFRPFHLVAPGFEAVRSEVREREPSHVAPGLPAPYAAVELGVAAPQGSVAAGLSAGQDHVLVRWSAETSRVTLEVRRDGRTRVVRRGRLSPTGPFGLAFALCENQVTALADTGRGWRPVLTERTRVARLVDLRRQEVLDRYGYAFEATGVASSVRAGLFCGTGLRDPHLVTHADGTPYLREGRAFLTWTAAGLGHFQQAHWTVWSLDAADPRSLRLESHLFFRRDGLVLGDHAGHLVRHEDRWLVAVSAWGDFAPGSIHVRHAASTADLLSGVHVLDSSPTPLPTRHGTWDPALTKVDGTWHVGFVESPSQRPFRFHPALASTTAEDWTDDLRPVAAAARLRQCEGTLFVTVAGTTWLLASDRDAHVYPVFDLAGTPRGRLTAPYPSNIPHPQLLPDPAGGWWVLTFDGTPYAERLLGYGGHGDVVVMHSG